MDPPAVRDLAADVECHVRTVLQGFDLSNTRVHNKLLKNNEGWGKRDDYATVMNVLDIAAQKSSWRGWKGGKS